MQRGTKEQTEQNPMAAEKVSMNFGTLTHLAKNSTFNPILPNVYKSAEMLWSTLLDQAYAHDKICISKNVFNKTNKRLQMLAKLVHTFEESIWRPEHAEMLAHTKRPEEVAIPANFHCPCCVDNIKQVHTLEAQLEESAQCTAERGKEICMLESRLSDKETYYSNMDKELLHLYTEINQFKYRAASTDALVSILREDLAASTQRIADLQQVINNLSRPDTGSKSPLPMKQVCISGTANEELATAVPTSPMDQGSRQGQVERRLRFTNSPEENRTGSSCYQGQDYRWEDVSRWDPYTSSSQPMGPVRPEESHPHHNKMERIRFLLRICKEIPKYDPKADPFASCDTFEGHCNKFSVPHESRMELFKLWLPTHLNQMYEAAGRTEPKNGQYHNEEERLSILMRLATGHWDVTPEVLTNFKPTIQDEPLALCSRFEAMYRKVTMDTGHGIPQGMIRMFVERFPYLDTAIRLSAAKEASLTDAAIIIEQCRQDLLLSKKSVKARQHVPVHDRSQDQRVQHAKPSTTVLPTAPPLERTGNLQCFLCLQFGHMKRHCPQRARSRNTDSSGNNNGFKMKPNYARPVGEQTGKSQGHLQRQEPKQVAVVNAPAKETVSVESNDSTKTIENPQMAVCTSQAPTGNLVNLD